MVHLYVSCMLSYKFFHVIKLADMIDCESETSEGSDTDTSANDQPAQGSFLKLLPPQLEVSPHRNKNLPPRS